MIVFKRSFIKQIILKEKKMLGESFQRLQALCKGISWRYEEGDGKYEEIPVRSENTGFRRMTLREFLSMYQQEMEDYYGEEFWLHEDDLIDDAQVGDTVIFCLVDDSEDKDDNSVPPHQKKNIRKSGKWRRSRIRHKWAYVNPLNRIHGFIILKDLTNKVHKDPILSISAVCATYFTEKRGIGGDLMKLAKDWGVALGYHDIVLEVANEYSGMGFEEESEEEESEEEESEEESEEEESEEEDEDKIWYPCESAISILSGELWRKCMRKDKRGNPVYNLDKEYIEEAVDEYLNFIINSDDNTKVWEGTSRNTRNEKEPDENEYGGFWYTKGKNSQKRLMGFYEMHGYKEDPDIHLNWCCFSEIPYPTMRLTL